MSSTKVDPIEHPSRIDRYRAAVSGLSWKESDRRASLGKLFDELSELTYAELRYYYARRVSSRRRSQIFRIVAWVLASIGILVPLLHPVIRESVPETFLSWGYVAFGAAGVVLIADNLFAGTSAFQRYTRAQLEIERLYTVFSIEWSATLALYDTGPSTDSLSKALDRAADYVKAFHTLMGTETAAWEKALEAGIAELRGKVTASEKGK